MMSKKKKRVTNKVISQMREFVSKNFDTSNDEFMFYHDFDTLKKL